VALLTSIPFYGHTLSLFWASRQVHFASPLAYVTFATSITRVLFLGMAWVNGPVQFVACAMLAQFLTPIHGPAYTEVMRQIYPEEIRGKAMGSVRMAGSVATMVAATLGGKLLDVAGFRVVFPIAAVAGVVASWIFGQIPYPRPAVSGVGAIPKPISPLRDLVRMIRSDRRFRHYETGVFLFGFGNLMMLPLIPILLVDRFHVSNFFVGQLAFATALTRVAFLYFWGHQIDRRGGLTVACEILVLMTIVPLCYATAAGPVPLFIAAIVSGCAMAGLELAVISSMIELARGRDPATFMAIHQTILGIRGITAPLVGTLALKLINLPGIFFLCAGLILLGALFVRPVPEGGSSGILGKG
jgi:MFS family permease